jgi:hypothetical protein
VSRPVVSRAGPLPAGSPVTAWSSILCKMPRRVRATPSARSQGQIEVVKYPLL